MGCGTNCCRSYVQLMNLIVLLIGLGIIGVALFLIIDENASEFLGSTAGPWIQYVTLALGILTVIFSSVGCCLANSLSKCRLTFYGIILFFIGAIVVIAGAATIVYKDYSNTIAIASASSTYPSLAPGVFGTQQYLADYEAGIFSACCANDNFGVAQCSGLETAVVCIFNENSYQAGMDSASNICDAFDETFSLCGQENNALDAEFQYFTVQFQAFLQDYVYPAGIAFIVMGALLILASIGSCVLACKNRNARLPRREHQSKQPQSAQPAGGPVALV